MFTGIVKEVGQVKEITRKSKLWIFKIYAKEILEEVKKGDSISVNGTCLTLTKKENCFLYFEAIESTLKKTNLKRLKILDFVNLEPALRLEDRLGGHFVLGHIDVESKIKNILKKENFYEFYIEYLPCFKKYLIKNGSIAIEGISLTLKKIFSRFFTVEIIPFTYQHTNLKYKKIGDFLNIEFDYLLKNFGR